MRLRASCGVRIAFIVGILFPRSTTSMCLQSGKPLITSYLLSRRITNTALMPSAWHSGILFQVPWSQQRPHIGRPRSGVIDEPERDSSAL